MTIDESPFKQALIRVLDELPSEKRAEVLDFALFLKERRTQGGGGLILRTVPASHLDALIGLVAWGGDALADTERLYDEHAEASRH